MRLTRPLAALAICLLAALAPNALAAQFSPRFGGGAMGFPSGPRFPGKRWGMIRQDGTVAMPFTHESLSRSGEFLISKQGPLQYLIRPDGQRVSEGYSSIHPLKNGFLVSKELHPGLAQGFLDEKGVVVVLPRYQAIGEPTFGIFLVKSGEAQGWINPATRTFVAPELALDLVQVAAQDLILGVQVQRQRVLGFHADGRVRFDVPAADWPEVMGNAVKIPGKGGLARWIDPDGKEIAPPRIQAAGREPQKDFYQAFSEDGKWGFKDGKGNILIQPTLDTPGGFVNGLVSPMFHGKYGVMDTKGRWTVQPIYQSLSDAGPDGWRVGTTDRASGVWQRVSPAGQAKEIPGHWSWVEPFDSQGQAIACEF